MRRLVGQISLAACLLAQVAFLAGCSCDPDPGMRRAVRRTPALSDRVKQDGEFCRDSANKYTDRCANFRFHLQLQAREDARRAARFGR